MALPIANRLKIIPHEPYGPYLPWLMAGSLAGLTAYLVLVFHDILDHVSVRASEFGVDALDWEGCARGGMSSDQDLAPALPSASQRP